MDIRRSLNNYQGRLAADYLVKALSLRDNVVVVFYVLFECLTIGNLVLVLEMRRHLLRFGLYSVKLGLDKLVLVGTKLMNIWPHSIAYKRYLLNLYKAWNSFVINTLRLHKFSSTTMS